MSRSNGDSFGECVSLSGCFWGRELQTLVFFSVRLLFCCRIDILVVDNGGGSPSFDALGDKRV